MDLDDGLAVLLDLLVKANRWKSMQLEELREISRVLKRTFGSVPPNT